MARRLLFLRGAFLASILGFPLAESPISAADRWIEVRSPHFVVVSNSGEKEARKIAGQFEIFRAVFQKALPKTRVDPGQPLIILAARNESTLKTLIPQYWDKKGNMHPIGVFVPGTDRHYVALRLDSEGENPYGVIYHEYVHLLISLNFQWVPMWLNEGLAEFYANSELGSKDVSLGRPSAAHLQLLQERRLLPLEVVLAVTHTSPQYNEADTSGVFYAESWALVHYLMLDNKTGHTKELAQFINLLQQGAITKDAFQQVFGDIKKFEQKLGLYMSQPTFYALTMKSPPGADPSTFTSRELGPAEAAAARGDFYVHTDRTAEARAALEEATRLDPKLAGPYESLGILSYRHGDREEALKWFHEAVQLDSKNFLAHYFYAFLSSQGSAFTPERIEIAEEGLRKAIELNPNFAPAYAALSQFYVIRGERLDEALTLARKSTELEPGTLTNHLAVANVLMRQGRTDDAQRLAQRVLEVAKTPQDRMAATQFLEQMRLFAARLEEQKRNEEDRRRMEEERAKQPAVLDRGATAAGSSATETAARPQQAQIPAESPRQTAPAEGRVATLTCKGKVLDFTLDYYGFKISLHAEDYSKIQFPASAQLPKNFDPCVGLKGRNIKAEYLAAKGKAYAGDVVQIEFDK
jgi:tetratricopeptide (TPR) repeat protein